MKEKEWWFWAFLAIALVVTRPAPAATVDFTPRLQKAYFEIQKLRLGAARRLIDAERSATPDNAVISYLDNYADLHYLLISEDREAYKKLSPQEDLRLEQIGKLPENAPFKRFLQAEIRLHWAFAKLKFGNELSGSWDIIKAYRLLEDNRKRFPDFTPTCKSLGLLHVLIGSIPENYGWVARMLGLRGDIQAGIGEIRKVVQEEPFFRQEAELTDILLHAYTLKLSPAQQARVRQWPKEQPDNLLLHFFATTTLIKEGESGQAWEFLADAPDSQVYIPFPFLDYLRGEILLQKGEYAKALGFYQSFLKKYRGFNYIKDGNFKQFVCLWLMDRDAAAKPFAEKALKEGSTIIEADQLARRVADEFLSNELSDRQKVLYKARYATDGGFYPKAWELVSVTHEDAFVTMQEKCELNYRKARILHKMGKTAAAAPFYQRALQLGQKNAAGFAASAALQLGYISMENHQHEKARAYFRQAMSFKKHEYKNSIDNKARAALTGLGD